MRDFTSRLVGAAIFAFAVGARAQEYEEGFVEDPPSPEPAAEESGSSIPKRAAPAAETGDADGARFRWGISGGGGFVSVAGATLGYGGLDLRFGAQINDLIGVYLQPQLGVYGGNYGGVNGVGGLAGASVLADFTFADSFFVAAGLGYGVLNNPAGPELHLRAGMYPVLGGGQEVARRKALMLGVDFRAFFLDGATGVSPTLSIGYESF